MEYFLQVIVEALRLLLIEHEFIYIIFDDNSYIELLTGLIIMYSPDSKEIKREYSTLNDLEIYCQAYDIAFNAMRDMEY